VIGKLLHYDCLADWTGRAGLMPLPTAQERIMLHINSLKKSKFKIQSMISIEYVSLSLYCKVEKL
jgi:hypothetical protein